MGGGCSGCGGCGSCTRTVEREFYEDGILSADKMVAHWEAGVETGESILWEALTKAMEEVAKDVIADQTCSLEESEKLITAALDNQFEVLKQDKEAVVADAEGVFAQVHGESERLREMQEFVLEHDR